MLTCTLDGQTLEVEPGTTILTAARSVGIDIPTFCFHERLSLSASCRMCLVEIEGRNKLEPACATAISSDMVIRTQTDKVAGTREDMLEILLANHPLDCPVCDKGGECELQDTVFRYGKGDSRLRDPKRVFRQRDIELNQVIVFNANRCIQCQRCVRVCEEVVGDVALGTAERGLDSEITGVGNSLKDCSHCGNCIEVCPVGALMSIPYRYKARPWDMVKTETICEICGTGCSLTVETRDGEFKRVKSDPETGLNGELLCAKGRFAFDAVESGRRVTEPMIRKDGTLEPVSWSEAIQLIANRVRAIKDNNGRIQGVIAPRQTNENAFMFQSLIRQVFGSHDIQSSTRFTGLHSPDGIKALAHLVTECIDRQPFETVLQADCILVLGANISEENPVSGYLLRSALRKQNKDLLVASSRPSSLDNMARTSCRLLPGYEAHLLSHLVTGVPPMPTQKLSDFASTAGPSLAAAKSLTLLIGTEMLRGIGAVQCLQWIGMTAEYFKSQGKAVYVQFLFDRPNQLGLWDMGCLTGVLPGWQLCEKAQPETTAPLDLQYVFEADPVRGSSEKCSNGAPASDPLCLIVQASHFSATVDRADVVLPTRTTREEPGSFTNNEGRAQRLRSVYPPPKGGLPTLKVFNLICEALEHVPLANSLDDVQSQIATKSPVFDAPDPDQKNKRTTPNLLASAPALWLEDSDLKANQKHLVTGDSLFQSTLFTSQQSVLFDVDQGPYVEMNPGTGPDHAFDGMTATLIAQGHSFTAPLRINRSLDDKTVFVPEAFLTEQGKKNLCCGDYPRVVKVSLSGVVDAKL